MRKRYAEAAVWILAAVLISVVVGALAVGNFHHARRGFRGSENLRVRRNGLC
jgi:hypothetical protein